MNEEEIFVVGKVNLNPVNNDKVPFIEIVIDTAGGRTDGEIILLKQITKQDNEYYAEKIKHRRNKK